MKIVEFLAMQVFSQPALFLGLIALLGLILQRTKTSAEIIEGTIKTVVGIVILFAGIGVFLQSLVPLTTLLTQSFGVTGILPDNFGSFGLAMKTYSREITLGFVIGLAVHWSLVRLLPWKPMKNIWLTGHVCLDTTTWFVVTLPYLLGFKGTGLAVASGIFVGVLWTVLPAIARIFVKSLTNDQFTLGHMETACPVVGGTIGKMFKGSKNCDEIELPGVFRVFNDYTVLLAVLMPALYIGIGVFAGPAQVTKLSGSTNWIIWLILSGLSFAGGVAVVLFGVRMFLAAIVPAFQGIAQKVIPGAIPALDSPVFFSFSPNAVIIGFLADLVAALGVMLTLVITGSPLVVFPGPIFVFFDGALAGVVGNHYGGWKGAAAAGFIVGIIAHAGALLLYPFMTFFHGAGVQYGGSDLPFLVPIFYLLKWIGHALGLV